MRLNYSMSARPKAISFTQIGRRIDQQNKRLQAKVAGKGTQKKDKADKLELSPQAKMAKMLESLVKKKEKLLENKNNLIARTLEKGGKLADIKPQLEEYDAKMKEIDLKMKELMLEQEEKEKQKKETDKSNYKKPESKKEVEQKNQGNIIQLDAGLKHTRRIKAAQKRIEGETRIVEMEIKLDIKRGHFTEGKQKRLMKLREQAENISKEIGNHAQRIKEKLEESQENEENSKEIEE